MKKLAYCGILLGFFCFLGTESWGREWTSGETKYEAALVKVFEEDNGELWAALRMTDSRLSLIAVNKLSKSDQAFIRDYQEKKILSGGEAIKENPFFPGQRIKTLVVSEKAGAKECGNPEKYAVLIGVTAYPHFSEMCQLHYCGKDMDLLAETLCGNGFSPENIFTLTNEEGSLEPTKANIENQIAAVLKMAGPEDTVLIAFSGHGVAFATLNNQAFLCPTDTPTLYANAEPEKFANALVSRDWVNKCFNESKSQYRIFIIDACRDDPLAVTKTLAAAPGKDGTKSMTAKSIKKFDPKSGGIQNYHLMASCSSGDQSIEPKELGHGVFTYFLAEGLRGYADRDSKNGNGDGRVSASEAFQYANKKVRDYPLYSDENKTEPFYQRPVEIRNTTDYEIDLAAVPENLPELDGDKAERLYKEARELVMKDQLSEAKAKIDEVLTIRPEDQTYLKYKTYVENHLEKENAAEDLYQEGVKYICSLDGRQIDEKKGIELLTQAMYRGNFNAQGVLAYLYCNGFAFSAPDPDRAFNLAQEAADKGNPDAFLTLGECYRDGKGTEKDEGKSQEYFQKTFQTCKKLAEEKNDTFAMNKLGWCYKNGLGIDRDYSEAVKWYRKAADLGHTYAMCNLADCYNHGWGVDRDYSEVVKWYRKAADLGDMYAVNNLGGYSYYIGNGVDQDYSEAVKWFRKSADLGYATAMRNLGNCYKNGEGVDRDYSEAVKWYRKSADLGNAVAMNDLGNCYKNGEGVDRDYSEAMKWFRKSAGLGEEYAMRNLGNCYKNSWGVGQDYSEAVKWYRKAAAKFREDKDEANAKKCEEKIANIEKK